MTIHQINYLQNCLATRFVQITKAQKKEGEEERMMNRVIFF